MKHSIIFFDMDGTLYQTEHDIIPESALDAIQKLKENGYIVCAATGRPLNQMKLILERVRFDYYILINGGYILDGSFNEIGTYPIDKQSVEDLVTLAKANDYGLMFHFGDATYIYNDFYPMYDFCKYCNVLDSLFYDINQTYHRRHPAYNAVLMVKDENGLKEFMKNHPNLRKDLINVKTDGFCFDIFNADNDKSNGVETILKKNSLTWSDAVCIGDSTNDIEMLQKADIGIAMGNASDYVKSFADFATTDIYHDGIYNAIKAVLSKDE